jgi:hypothetical protein
VDTAGPRRPRGHSAGAGLSGLPRFDEWGALHVPEERHRPGRVTLIVSTVYVSD